MKATNRSLKPIVCHKAAVCGQYSVRNAGDARCAKAWEQRRDGRFRSVELPQDVSVDSIEQLVRALALVLRWFPVVPLHAFYGLS